MTDDLSRLPDTELERALADLGQHLIYPPTPPIVPAVRSCLLAAPTQRRPVWSSWLAPRWRPVLAILVLALVAGLAVTLSEPTRTTIADRLGLRGLTITHLPTVPPAMPGRPLRATLGTPLTLEQAQSRVPYQILTPTLPELGAPDEVYLSELPTGGQVALLYRARPDSTLQGETGVGLLLTQFRGDLLAPASFGKGLAPETGKGLGPQAQLDEVTVNGARGYWIEGPPHLFYYRDATGQVREDTARLVGNVLLWEQAGLTLRLESSLARAQALRIAASVQ
jgi:hypothetical protein